MPRFVALLRGVNVGGANRVPMAELRALLAALGHGGVRTLLNSGNAVFTSAGRSNAAHAARIRKALAERLDVDVPVIVKSAKDVATMQAENRLAGIATNPSRLLVAFTSAPEALEALAGISALVRAPERFQLGRHALYLWCANGISKSEAAAALLGKAGRAATTRNWATVLKIDVLLRENVA